MADHQKCQGLVWGFHPNTSGFPYIFSFALLNDSVICAKQTLISRGDIMRGISAPRKWQVCKSHSTACLHSTPLHSISSCGEDPQQQDELGPLALLHLARRPKGSCESILNIWQLRLPGWEAAAESIIIINSSDHHFLWINEQHLDEVPGMG